MDYGKLAAEVIRLVGGKENINDVGHCATRLRFSLKDAGLAKTDELKATDGVIGVVNKGGQYQVIIGNEVNEVYAQVTSQLGVEATPRSRTATTTRPPRKRKAPWPRCWMSSQAASSPSSPPWWAPVWSKPCSPC